MRVGRDGVLDPPVGVGRAMGELAVEVEGIALAGPRDAARFMIDLRREGLTVPIFGGPRIGRRLFAQTAGLCADGVRFPLLWEPSVAQNRSATFARRFQQHSGIEPDYTAAYTYDAMNLLIAAIRKAGLNRARIRDAIRELSSWSGVTGTIAWDPTGHNHRPVRLGIIRNGTRSADPGKTHPHR